MRDVKNGVGAAREFYLAGETFHALVLGQQVHIEVRQRGGSLTARFVAAVIPVAWTTAGAITSRTAGAIATRTTGTGTAGTIAARAATGSITPGRTVAEGAVAASATRATAGFLIATVVGETVGVGVLLRPRGEKLQFQIEFGIGLLAHENSGVI